jgi:hypothetical protein
MDVKERSLVGGLINQMQNRDRWTTVESTLINLYIFIKGGDFLIR